MKFPQGATVTVESKVVPLGIAKGIGEMLSTYVGSLIESAIVADAMASPETPLTMTVVLPGCAFFAAINVSLLEPSGPGVRSAETPPGNGDMTARSTLPENPELLGTVIVVAPEMPG
jgi:hypothetical protein